MTLLEEAVQKCLVRCDGSKHIGMGHVIRCLSLAKQLRHSGFEVLFLSKHSEGIEKIESNGFKVIKLQSPAGHSGKGFYYGSEKDLDSELEEMAKIIQFESPDSLIIDSYNISHIYLYELRKLVKVAYIDDRNSFAYPVDIVINGNVNARELKYEGYGQEQILLLGTDYNLIRDEFKNLPRRKINKKAGEIMITTGGADPFNLSARIAEAILKKNIFEDITINIILGPAFTNGTEIKKLAEHRKNIVIHENPKNMPEIMMKSDIAISSAGSTLYELCSCGTPTIAYVLADNQEGIAHSMEKMELVENLGRHSGFEENILTEALSRLMDDFELREKMSAKGQLLVDGNGCKRVTEVLMM